MRSNHGVDQVLRLLTLLALAAAAPLAAVNTVTIDGLFADWADEFCRADTVCDDFSNQFDAKGACIASNHPAPTPADTIYLRFDFDDFARTGANSQDGCWLVDIDQNGFVDAALCFTLQNNPVTLTQTRYFTCGDTTNNTCASDVESIPVPTGIACAVDNDVNAPEILFSCPGDTRDSAVECSVPLSVMGWSTGVVSLLRGCTFASSQPNSNSSDCLADVGTPLIIDPVGGGNTPVELQGFTVE